MMFPEKGRQLYVGEGDFSLTKSMCKNHILPEGTIVSCFSKELTKEANTNAEFLSSSGMCVMTGVDATKLEAYPEIAKHQYDYIIFNFPHTGRKMKIQLCRNLLKEFLCCAESLLAHNGQVWVTLCAGQGGTAGDTVRRAWSDTWQLTVQAAAARLLLRRLQTFQPELYPDYRPTGNRGSEARGFHTGRGVTHVLARGTPVPVDQLCDRLQDSGRRLMLDSAEVPLAQYWLRRLPPAPLLTLAELIVGRLAAPHAPRRLVVRRDGRTFAADAPGSDGGDIVCGGVDGAGCRPAGTCVTYTADLDAEVGPDVESTPLRTDVTVVGPDGDVPDARAALAALGLACKLARPADAANERLLASCGRQLCVASTRTTLSTRVVTYHVDRVAACIAGANDWRCAARCDVLSWQPLVLASLHAPTYTFDMAFWLDGGAPVDAPFSWSRLRRCLRAVLGETLVSLTSIDEYTQPESGRRARTVRMVYQDLSGPLSYQLCRQLHVQVLPAILRSALGVEVR